MKQANSTEIDRLLQRHARRWGTAASSGEGAPGDGASKNDAGAHLDADEMNSYAEGALPPAARARYASHLADCDSCRAIVTNLTLAAHPAYGEESSRDAPESSTPSKSWWSAMAALFAPPVLRYAVPALLLLGVIVVALVATRDRSETQFVAQRGEDRRADGVVSTQATPQSAPAQVQSNESAATTPDASATNGKNGANTTTKDPSLDGTSQTNANAVSRAPSAPPGEMGSMPTVAPDASPRREESVGNDGLYAKEPQDAPPPPVASRPSSSVENKVESKKERLEQSASDASAGTETTTLGRSSSDNKDAEARDNAALAGGSASQQSGAPQARSRSGARRAAKSVADKSAEDNDRAENSTETRSVAGRRFRRQGEAWVDVAYSSSRSTINVARGSDQYRALTADEPTIRSIADQLGGVVIVIWKGKAYRIH